MTIRQWLGRRSRWLMRGTMGVALACMLALWLNPPQAAGPPSIPLLVLVAAVATSSVAGHFFLFRCPRCRCNLAPLVIGSSHGWWGVDPRLVCCPYCTLRLDERVPEPKAANEHDRYQTEF